MKKRILHTINLIISLWLFLSALSCSDEESEEIGNNEMKEWSALNIMPPMVHIYALPGENPPDEVLEVWSEQKDIDWTLSTEASWLTLSKTEGIARSLVQQRKTEVLLIIDSSELDKGNYSTVITAHNEQRNYTRELPVLLHITEDPSGHIPDIDIRMEPQEELKDTLFFTQPRVTFDTLPKSVTSNQLRQDALQSMYYSAGDLCLLLTGKLQNNTEDNISVIIESAGYDAEGYQSSWSLQVNHYHLLGVGRSTIDIPGNSTVDFKLYMNWAEDIETITIVARKNPESDIPPP